MILIFIAVYVYVYTYDKFGKIGSTFPRVFKKKRNIEEAKDIRLHGNEHRINLCL